MIKKYNLYLEKISLENSDVINILQSLETGKDKDIIIKKLINNIDNNGKNILMQVVQTNDEKMIDFILKYKIDINYKNKNGENVLFYCKNLKTFRKLYNLGADPLARNTKTDTNILIWLSSKKLFNVELYQDIIDKGVDIQEKDKNKQCVFLNSIKNKKMVEFLIKKGININEPVLQQFYLARLFYNMKYEMRQCFSVFDVLLKNGLKIHDTTRLIEELDNYATTDEVALKFIEKYKNYFDSEFFIKFANLKWRNPEFQRKLVDITEDPNLYFTLKHYYRNSMEGFYKIFPPEQYQWLEDSKKYNL